MPRKGLSVLNKAFQPRSRSTACDTLKKLSAAILAVTMPPPGSSSSIGVGSAAITSADVGIVCRGRRA
jgi:hypothetical protein